MGQNSIQTLGKR